MRRLLLTLFVLLGLTATVCNQAHCHTECNHNPNTLGYWDNRRTIPARLTEVDGSELTFKASDANLVRVSTFHTSDATRFYYSKDTTIHNYKTVNLFDDRGKLWFVTYCVYCHEIFAMTRLDI